jgi:peptidoglycan hydrolase-like protein with peptidoglycan-binding domain
VLKPDGDYGPKTVAVVRAAQEQCGVTGPDAVGTIVGPRTNRAFYARGYRG